jgi:hypothetical protein
MLAMRTYAYVLTILLMFQHQLGPFPHVSLGPGTRWLEWVKANQLGITGRWEIGMYFFALHQRGRRGSALGCSVGSRHYKVSRDLRLRYPCHSDLRQGPTHLLDDGLHDALFFGRLLQVHDEALRLAVLGRIRGALVVLEHHEQMRVS